MKYLLPLSLEVRAYLEAFDQWLAWPSPTTFEHKRLALVVLLQNR